MKVFIGSVIIILIICFGIWLMLSPSFKKVGDTAHRLKEKLGEDENGTNKKENK
ncbi:hypothetical protein [Bacillus sp. FJAT-27231]|uniref:hypothetical protein n=1 Tax=Bacillus sp. FJAT-27231 TaxID=1679168 RepID=UPI0018CCB03F|nr:hypothetical protein [Bacillus sp. FJAT-27231]